MNIGYVAMRAFPRLCGALRHRGMWCMTKQDLLDALKNHPRSTDAIFWWCQAWHDGDDELYKIMCNEIPDTYMPRPWSPIPTRRDPATGKEIPNPNYDPVLVELIEKLDVAFKKIVTPALRPVKLSDVREGHVLTAGSHHIAIPNRWPCRVYRSGGTLGVICSSDVPGAIRIDPKSNAAFLPLTEDAEGYVVGFRR